MAEWGFLERWRVVLHNSASTEFNASTGTAENNDTVDPNLHVSISFAETYLSGEQTYCLRLLADERNQLDATRLRQLREAMELFTLLSIVNNKAFQELMPPSTETQPPMTREQRIQLPRWTFDLVGIRPPNDAAAAQGPVTWGALLGFPEDPWEYSLGFKEAITRLEAIGIDESTTKYLSNGLSIYWYYQHYAGGETGLAALHTTDVNGSQKPVPFADPIWGQLGRLFDTVVPPMVQMCGTAGPNCTALSVTAPCERVCATIQDWDHSWAPELTVALARTPISRFDLSIGHTWLYSRQARMDTGFLLSTLICGRPLCAADGQSADILPDTVQLEYGDLYLSGFWATDTEMFVAICSAVAEASAGANLSRLGIDSSCGRWTWLIYALCCGSSHASVSSADISQGPTMTQSDILAISAVLRANYPQPILESGDSGCHQYGFVDVQEGSELQLCEVREYEENELIVSRACHCRALHDPLDGEWATVIVPGYGVCQAKLGEGVRFTPDSENPAFPVKRLCGSLDISRVNFETAAVLMDLLTLVTSGLHRLTLVAPDDDATAAIQIDLGVLSTACPELRHLSVAHFDVVVLAHNASLRRWPVKTILLQWRQEHRRTLSDVTRCLKNTELRMTRELTSLEVRPSSLVDPDEVKELNSRDGEFLPVAKEKLPAQSKAALMSVVTSATSAALNRLMDANILSLIFVFASTPAQRSVHCWTDEDYESDPDDW